MTFNKEKNMTPVVVNHLRKILNLGDQSIALSKEYPFSNRIIDLTFLIMNNNLEEQKSRQEIVNSLNKLSINELYVLSLISKFKVVSIQKISNLIYSNYYMTKEKYFDVLENLNLIIKCSKFKYYCNYNIDDILGMIYALELKLSDWKGALKQAKDTRKFADYSFVAMDDIFLKNNSHIINHYKNENIGLLGVGFNDINIYNKPEKKNNIDPKSQAFQKLRSYREILANKKKWQIIS